MRDRLRSGAVMVPKQRAIRTEVTGIVFVGDDIELEGARCHDILRLGAHGSAARRLRDRWCRRGHFQKTGRGNDYLVST